MLVDIDEWGQVVIINMLTRYARSQFVDPNAQSADKENSNADKKEAKSDDDDDDEHISWILIIVFY